MNVNQEIEISMNTDIVSEYKSSLLARNRWSLLTHWISFINWCKYYFIVLQQMNEIVIENAI